jgi:hypothetical protein
MANKLWLCDCAITIREIRAYINFNREMNGLRPLTSLRFYQMRAEAAEAFLDAHPHGNKGLDRNPFLPDRVIGRNYIFKKNKANRLIRLGLALKIRKPGRQPGTRVVRGKVVQTA